MANFYKEWFEGFDTGVSINREALLEIPVERSKFEAEIKRICEGKPDGFARGYRFARINHSMEYHE